MNKKIIIISAFIIFLITGLSTAQIWGPINNPIGDVTSAPTYSGLTITGTPLGVSSGGTGNTINAGRLYCYDHTAHSLYAATGWVASPLAEYTLVTCTVSGGAMGASGALVIDALFTVTSGANNKILKFKNGGSTIGSSTVTTAASGDINIGRKFINRNSQSTNISYYTNQAASSGWKTATTVDTSQSQSLIITGQTTTESGVQTTSLSGDGATCTAVKASHGYTAGEYIQVAGGSNCDTSGHPNWSGTALEIITAVTNTFTYACSCSGAESGTQPTAYRFSKIQLESYDVQILKP